MVYYTIAVIRLFSKKNAVHEIVIAFNTDSIELQNIVRSQHILEDIEIVKRRPELAEDLTAKAEVIKDTYFAVKDRNVFDVIIDLDITSPLRTVEDIEKAISEFNSDGD